jgi:ABC-type uncharacterized transport system involved in gliding motility auxiliary subunit
MVQRILGILSWVGVALVFGALGVRFVKPEWDQYAIYAAWAGLALVLLYTVGQWREIVAHFQRRNTRYGTIASISVIVVLGIVVAANYLSVRRNKRWDLTENKQYSLSDQSTKLLQGLQSPVKFIVFDQDVNFDRFRSRLGAYQYGSDKVAIEYIDPEKDPSKAGPYKIEAIPTIVIDYMGRTQRTNTDTEQDLTNALIKLVNPQERKIYFLSGHGEKDPANSERVGYSGIADALKQDNYQFDKLVLAQTNEIPKDASVLVIAGPKTDLLESEVPLLTEYLTSRQGKLLVLLDPTEDFKPVPMPRITGLLNEWGIKATESVVVDLSGLTQVATVPVAGPPYPEHAITRNFALFTMFPMARAIVAETSPQKRAGQSFLQTAQRSWGEMSLDELAKSQAKPEPERGDVPGPVSIGVATAVPAPTPEPAPNTQKPADEAPKPETRVAAIGDSDFAANNYLGVQGNRDLFMNTVNWLAQQENLIAIRPRDASDRRLTLTANKTAAIFWMSIFIIPAAVLTAGAYTWWRRR